MSLAQDLESMSHAIASSESPLSRRVRERGIIQRRDLSIERSALAKGEMTPEFALKGNGGRLVTLDELLDRGPTVLMFYRGRWCPYCRLTLTSYQRALPDIQAAGGALVAITPETPDEAALTAAELGLDYEVLSDHGSRTAAMFGILYDVTGDAAALCKADGIDLAQRNADPRWVLPLPATYVVGVDGVVTYAFVDPDYRLRAEPLRIIEALDALARGDSSHSRRASKR